MDMSSAAGGSGVGPLAGRLRRPGPAAHDEGGEQGEDGADEEANRRGHGGDSLRDHGRRLPDAVQPGGCLLSRRQALASCEPAEHGQHGGELRVGPEQRGLDALQLALLAVVKAHDVLLSCDRRSACAPAPGCGSWPASGPASRVGQRPAGRRRATAPRPAAARTISTPPARLLDQNIGSAMVNFELRMGPAMISQTPSSALPTCRLANARGLARAKAPTPATARPEMRLTTLALVPPCWRVRNHGDRATQTPVSTASTADIWAPRTLPVADSAYSAWPEAPSASGRRISGVDM